MRLRPERLAPPGAPGRRAPRTAEEPAPGVGEGAREPPSSLLRALPNCLSAARLAAIPVLWAVALLADPRALGVGVAAAASTDLLDGYLARRWRVETPLGSRLDSLADHLLTASTLAWLARFHPELYRDHAVPLSAWAALAAAAAGVAVFRFGRPVALHLASAKAAGFTGYLFAIHLLATGGYPGWLFALALGLMYFAAGESLLLLLLRDRVDEHQRTVFHRRRGG